MKRSYAIIALAVFARALSVPTRAEPSRALRNLDIYWIDTEGGAATLIVSPSGESMLIDTGYPDADRDAKRIFAVAQHAGLTAIDHLVISHYHRDHVGGLAALAKLMPIGHYYGPNDQLELLVRQLYCRVHRQKGIGVGDNRLQPIVNIAKPTRAYVTNSYQRLALLPGIEGIWQGHLSLVDKGPGHNTAEEMIANLDDTPDCKGHWIKASVAPDGKFTLINSRNGFSKTYQARQRK
jgi:hypothetical protein